MITYIIKATVCSILLLLVYRFLLQREKMYAFNRAYLLFSILFSLLVPLITFEVTVNAVVPEDLPLPLLLPFEEEAAVTPAAVQGRTVTVWQVALTLYLLITAILLFRFLRNLYHIRRAIAHNTIINYKEARLILIHQDMPAHTFLHYIFISKADYDNPSTGSILLTHELSHVRQKHSWDVLLIELLLVFAWLNPAWVFYKRYIQLNHELQADDAVIKTHTNIPAYQHLLLDKIEQQHPTRLTSSFNYFITKKRLTMMTQSPNSKRIACLQLALLPLFIAAIFLFSGRTYAQVKPIEKKAPEKTTPIQEPVQNPTDTSRKIIVREMGRQFPPGPGATPEELKEFNAIFERSTDPNQKNIAYKFSKEDKKRLKALYMTMSAEQRKDFPGLLFSKPPARRSPTTQQLKDWQNPKMYGVWIDNKRVSNDVLANYQPADFALYYSSRLSKNAVNYGKHYVQIDLHTPEDYNKTYKGEELQVFVFKKVDVKVKAPQKP